MKNIKPKEAFKLLAANTNNDELILIDIRTPEEYSEGHIRGAVNLDYFDDKINDKLNDPDKNKTYILYCKSGRRSGAVAEMMHKSGFKRLNNILGGFEDCQNEKFEIVK